jgi:hypothetical protein
MTTFVNATSHPLNFRNSDGSEFEIAPSGVVLNAKFQEEAAGTHPGGAMLLRSVPVASPEELAKLEALEQEYPGALIIGSMIAAQAFPGRVVAMIAAPGFERIPPPNKRMDPSRFTIY